MSEGAIELPPETGRYLTAADVLVRLRARFPPPEYAVIPNVADALGGRTSRRADALAMGLWSSRGLELHGFEVKVSRGDWLREKKDPSKAEAIARFCDRWWLAVSEASIVKDGELPPNWGLLVAHGNGLRCVTEAPKRDAQPMTRMFLAALLRAAHNGVDRTEIDAMVYRARKEERKKAAERSEHQNRSLYGRCGDLEKSIAAFEAASGVHISSWNAGKIGEAVRVVLQGKVDLEALKRAREHVAALANAYNQAIDSVERFAGGSEGA